MDLFLKEAYEQTKVWVVKVTENSVLSILKEPALNFMDQSCLNNTKLQEERLNQLKLVVKKILYSIFDAIHSQSLAPPFEMLKFLYQLTTPGSFAPDNFLMKFELEYLKLGLTG
jgi:hypothetical protein